MGKAERSTLKLKLRVLLGGDARADYTLGVKRLLTRLG
jgi:hypothetical protein